MDNIDQNTLLIAWVPILIALVPIFVMLVTIAFQLRSSRKQREEQQSDEIRRHRIDVISDLFAYRFVLTGGIYSADAISRFNYALNKIPIEFHNHKEILDSYREIGNDFTAEKFYSFLRALTKEVNIDADLIDKSLIESVPAVNGKGFGIGMFTKSQFQAEVKISPNVSKSN